MPPEDYASRGPAGDPVEHEAHHREEEHAEQLVAARAQRVLERLLQVDLADRRWQTPSFTERIATTHARERAARHQAGGEQVAGPELGLLHLLALAVAM